MNIMKKFLIICLAATVGISSVFAEDVQQYKTACPFVRVTTNLLGYNFIVKKIAQGVLRKALNKNVKGEYKVKFDSFSGVDLKKGKFRGLTIDGEDMVVDDELYVSKLHMETTSDFNYVEYKKKPMVFKTDLPMDYSVEITESDLNKTMAIGKTFETISSILPLVTLETPKIKLEKEKVRLNSSLKLPFNKSVKFSMSASLKVENGKIVMNNVESSSSNKDVAQKLVNLINKQSLLENINLNLFDDTETNVSVNSVKVDNKKIYVTGNVLIKKS